MKSLDGLCRAATVALVISVGARAQAQAVPPSTLTGPVARPELPIKRAPQPTTGAITPADLMTRLYIFADDSMQGREAGTVGHVRGTEYIIRELKRLGVKPAGEDGGYYQVVPVIVKKLDAAKAVFSVDGAPLAAGTDFHPFPGIEGLPFASCVSVTGKSVVFGGRLGAPDAIKPADAKGKLVVFLPPVIQGQPRWQVWAAGEALASYEGIGGFVVAGAELVPPDVWKALADIAAEAMELKSDMSAPDFPPFVMVTRAAGGSLVGAANVDSAAVNSGSKKANLMYGECAGAPAAPARNVVAMVEGSDPKLKGQYVVLSAHSDHNGFRSTKFDHDSLRVADLISRPMGVETPERPLTPSEQAKFSGMLDSVRKLHAQRADSIFNGADDDGSGSMGLLELAEYFQTTAQKPKRSILFVWNVAEEKGLFGSEWFTEHPTVPRDSLAADINIDMIGRGAAYDIENGGPSYLQILGSRRLSTEYGNWVEETNQRPEFSFKLDYQFDANGHPQQYYCRSDHWNFARWGIPTVFFSTGSHVDYHMVTDEPQYIDYPHYSKVVNFVAALAGEVANKPSRATVDKPKPDPHGDCKQ